LARWYLGNLYFSQEKLREAIDQWQLATKLLQEIGEGYFESVVGVRFMMGYFHLGDYESAFRASQIAVKSAIDQGNKAGAAHLLSWESIHALRHSTLEHARQSRLQSLKLYEESGVKDSIAWGTWEMGEIHRVEGDLAGALEWFEKAKDLFEELDDASFPIFYARGLGELAMAVGDYTRAKAHFSESIRLEQEVGHEWARCYALWELGRAEIALGENAAARDHIAEALSIARGLASLELVFNCLAGYAMYYAAIGNIDRTIELSAFVLAHSDTPNETKAQMVALLQSLPAISQEQRVAAAEAGRNLNLEDVYKQLEG
jgi:tetratricopeptide (TPR) repeat protein